MQVQTILNSVQKFKGFVYKRVTLEKGAEGPRLRRRVDRRSDDEDRVRASKLCEALARWRRAGSGESL